MSPRLLFLLNARNGPSWHRAGHSPRGLSDLDWMDAQAAAARMPGRWHAPKVVPHVARMDRVRRLQPPPERTAVLAAAAR